MPSSTYPDGLNAPEKASVVREGDIEGAFIERLRSLKYEHRPDIHDRASLERNFRGKFESLNRVTLTDAEFARLLDEIVTPDVFTASKTLRSINSFSRDDGTPLNYSLVNLKDWCKNHFEVIHQLRINSKRNQQRRKNDQPTYKEMLAPLSDKRIVFIFDECHRSQFGENHKAIKEFFPKAQLFGFTGTPIFEANASLQKIEDEQASMRTTADLFQKQLHA